MQQKVFCIGECTYDILFKNNLVYKGHPGGSQLNTALSLANLGIKAAMVSYIGNDFIGDVTSRFLEEQGVGTDFIVKNADCSRVALANISPELETQYQFYKPTQIPILQYPTPKKNDIIIFGSSFAIKKQGRAKLLSFVQDSKNKGALVMYDPNYRAQNQNDEMLNFIEENFSYSDLIRCSSSDLINIYNTNDLDYIAGNLIRNNPNLVLIITGNENNVTAYHDNAKSNFKVNKITPVSTVGAGDTFNAGIIHGIYNSHIIGDILDNLSKIPWSNIIENSITLAQEVCMSENNYYIK